MNQDQRLMLAMLLSVMVFMVYSWYTTSTMPPPQEEPVPGTVSSATEAVVPPVADPIASATSPQPAAPTRPNVQPTTGNWGWINRAETPEYSDDIVVTSNQYRIVFSRTGGIPTRWQLTQYDELLSDPRFLRLRAETGDELLQQRARMEFNYLTDIEEAGGAEPVHALNPVFDPGDSGLLIRWGDNQSDQWIPYESEASEIVVGETEQTLVFTHDSNGVRLEKSYTFYPDGYHVDFRVRIVNQSDVPVGFGDESYYDLLWMGGFGFPSFREDARNDFKIRQQGSVEVKPLPTLEGEFQRGTRGMDDRRPLEYPFPAMMLVNEQVDWIGVGQKYFAAVIMPRSLTQRGIQGLQLPDERGNPELLVPVAGVRMGLQTIPAGGMHRDEFIIYVGPIDENELAKAAPEMEDAKIIFWKSFMGPIGNIMTGLLQWLYGIVGNYGVAIILLTVMVKILMFPLYHKQLVSMKKMQALSPQLNALKEKYKNDPQKQQKETMELFKKHKVNPLSGCLPILPTIPIFIALYATFSTSVELRGAEFFGWIHDLSVPDGAFYLPIGTYIFAVNILPLAYAILMLISTSLNKVEGPNAVAMRIVPLVFVFFFWSIASGVILYFVIGIAIDLTQRILLDRFTKEPPIPEKSRGK